MGKVQGQEQMAHLRNAGDGGGPECGTQRLAGYQVMEDIIGSIRELMLYPEHNGDHRKVLTRGVTWLELQFRKTHLLHTL